MENHTARQTNAKDFIKEVKQKFEYTIAAYERTVEAGALVENAEMSFSFQVENGKFATSVLQDKEKLAA